MTEFYSTNKGILRIRISVEFYAQCICDGTLDMQGKVLFSFKFIHTTIHWV